MSTTIIKKYTNSHNVDIFTISSDLKSDILNHIHNHNMDSDDKTKVIEILNGPHIGQRKMDNLFGICARNGIDISQIQEDLEDKKDELWCSLFDKSD